MASLVFFTTMSFTVNMHFCGHDLMDFSFVQQPENCGMDQVKAPVKPSCDIMLSKKSCCTDKQFSVHGQHEIKTSFDRLSIDQQVFVSTFVYSYINLFEALDKKPAHYKDYNPPFLERDLLSLNQTFLI